MRELAEELLLEHWYWAKGYRPKLGAPRISPYSRESVSSRQWDNTSDIADESCRRSTMEAVEWCIDALPGYQYAQAIGIEMRNRASGAKVWRAVDCAVSYADALTAILPKMREKCLI